MTNRFWKASVVASLLLSCSGPAQEKSGYLFVVGQSEEPAVIDIAGWQSHSRLPFAIEAGKPVMVSGTPVEIEPGTALLFHADTGAAEQVILGRDIKADTLIVRGDPDAITDLASRLTATATEGADGASALTAKDMFDRASYLEAPERILDVRPERIARAAGADNGAGSDMPLPQDVLGSMGLQPWSLPDALRKIAAAASVRAAAAAALPDAPIDSGRLPVPAMRPTEREAQWEEAAPTGSPAPGSTYFSTDSHGMIHHAIILGYDGRYSYRLCSSFECNKNSPSFSGPYSIVGKELRLVPEASLHALDVPRYFRFRIGPGNTLKDRDSHEQFQYGELPDTTIQWLM